jgi:cell division protein FtsB
MEEQAQERNKQLRSENEPYKREIERLREELAHEKARGKNQISKKNAEIAYFKSELDALLSEI